MTDMFELVARTADWTALVGLVGGVLVGVADEYLYGRDYVPSTVGELAMAGFRCGAIGLVAGLLWPITLFVSLLAVIAKMGQVLARSG